MSVIKTVTPTNVAEFLALRWEESEEAKASLLGMAARYGWTLVAEPAIQRRGKRHRGITILGRNRKRYTIISGEWIIALGANGSIRVCSDKKYRQDYREVEENE